MKKLIISTILAIITLYIATYNYNVDESNQIAKYYRADADDYTITSAFDYKGENEVIKSLIELVESQGWSLYEGKSTSPYIVINGATIVDTKTIVIMKADDLTISHELVHAIESMYEVPQEIYEYALSRGEYGYSVYNNKSEQLADTVAHVICGEENIMIKEWVSALK